MASRRNGTLYTGSTDGLLVRAAQHKSKRFVGFTARHGVDRLVWFERHPTRDAAFRRERQIKKWNRAWKLRMIESMNPHWNDLAEEIRLGDLKDAAVWIPPAESPTAFAVAANVATPPLMGETWGLHWIPAFAGMSGMKRMMDD